MAAKVKPPPEEIEAAAGKQERLRWILENRGEGGEPLAERALSTAAGMAHTHCTQMLAWPGRGKVPGINPNNARPRVWKAYARAGRVSTLWLTEGQEPREPYEGDDAATGHAVLTAGDGLDLEKLMIEEGKRYPSKLVVFHQAKALKYQRAALIGLVYGKAKGKNTTADPGEDFWWDVLDKADNRANLQTEKKEASARKALDVGPGG